MNKKFTIALMAGIIGFIGYSFVSLNYSNNIHAFTNGSPGGRTNSPGDASTCTGCHQGTLNSGNGTATVTSTGLTNGYTPGQTYTIAVGITGAGTSTKIGFEATAERDANNSKTGTLVVTDGTRTKGVNSGNGISHTSAGAIGTAVALYYATTALHGTAAFPATCDFATLSPHINVWPAAPINGGAWDDYYTAATGSLDISSACE